MKDFVEAVAEEWGYWFTIGADFHTEPPKDDPAYLLLVSERMTKEFEEPRDAHLIISLGYHYNHS